MTHLHPRMHFLQYIAGLQSSHPLVLVREGFLRRWHRYGAAFGHPSIVSRGRSGSSRRRLLRRQPQLRQRVLDGATTPLRLCLRLSRSRVADSSEEGVIAALRTVRRRGRRAPAGVRRPSARRCRCRCCRTAGPLLDPRDGQGVPVDRGLLSRQGRESGGITGASVGGDARGSLAATIFAQDRCP